MKKYLLTVLALSIMMLSGCEKINTGNGKDSAAAIRVDAVTERTKASVITTEYLEELGAFKLRAYQNDVFVKGELSGADLKDITVSYDATRSEDKWRIDGNQDYSEADFNWPDNQDVEFYAYAPVSVKGNRILGSKDGSDFSFSYSANVVSGKVDSGNCDDIIFAYKSQQARFSGKTPVGESDKVDIHFYHALSQIRFCVSTTDGSFNTNNFKLVSVKFVGLKYSGGCVYSGAETDISKKFAWTLDSSTTDYFQSFNTADFSGKTLPENWEDISYGSGSAQKTLATCTGDVLFTLPQNVSGIALEAVFQTNKGENVTMSSQMPSTTWLPGMYYTYKLNATGDNSGNIVFYVEDWVLGGGEITL